MYVSYIKTFVSVFTIKETNFEDLIMGRLNALAQRVIWSELCHLNLL